MAFGPSKLFRISHGFVARQDFALCVMIMIGGAGRFVG
jgi:hypothetical protein